MTIRLYIDPGKLFNAWAVFVGSHLETVYLVAPEVDACDTHKNLTSLIIEKPQIYPGSDEKDPNDCLDVFGAARYAEALIRYRGGPPAQYFYPHEWKSSFKKPPHHRQVWAALSQQEREVFARDAGLEVEFIGDKIEAACERLARTGKVTGYSWKAHNLLDAVGLGLWHHRRLRGRRLPPPVAKV